MSNKYLLQKKTHHITNIILQLQSPKKVDNEESNSISHVSYSRNPQDYETGIKPASHRLESHSSSCSVHPNYPASAVSTPKHSTTSNSVQKQIRSTNFRQKECLPLEDFQTRKKVIFYHFFTPSLYNQIDLVFFNKQLHGRFPQTG